MRALGRNPTHAEVNTMMAKVDVDHNGKLDLTEFIVMMYNHNLENNMEEENIEEMRMAFRYNWPKYVSTAFLTLSV